jgi:tetratricopeptide (TPR) repeat protein
MLLGHKEGLSEHAYRDTDDLITRNRAYARHRAAVRHLADGQVEAAWQSAAALRKDDDALGWGAQVAILDSLLRRVGQDVPEEWINTVVGGAPPHTLLRLGHAAYDGERFELAGPWLEQGGAQVADAPDAETALRIAQCRHLAGEYALAAEQFGRVLRAPDLDNATIPTVQLQQVAALVLAARTDEARAAAYRVDSLRRPSPRIDVVAATSARDIARFLTGLTSENLLAASVEALLGRFAEGSLRFHDDGPFFAGELARQRGDLKEAQAQYQRCIDLARDTWPSNWARFRLLQLSRAAP